MEIKLYSQVRLSVKGFAGTNCLAEVLSLLLDPSDTT